MSNSNEPSQITDRENSPAVEPQQLTTTASVLLPDSKTPTPQPLKKVKTSSTAAVPASSSSKSSHPGSVGPPPLPEGVKGEDVIGGSPLRKYINTFLTVELIEGIKKCVATRPERPLKWLGEWLILRDLELNGNGDTHGDVKMEEN